MPVDIGSPAPRTTLIGRDAKGAPIYGDKAYIDFWLALARAVGGPGRVATTAEIAQAAAEAMAAAEAAQTAAEGAQAAATAAQGAAESVGIDARAKLGALRFPSVRQGANVTVTQDAEGYVIAATAGTPDWADANNILAGQVFGS